jgi:glycerol-3-phosphate dehydrogenase
LSGGEFEGLAEISSYIEQQTGESKQIGGNFQLVSNLVLKYGKNTEKIIELAYELWSQIEDKEIVLRLAEIKYCEENEMTIFPSDFWIRRTGALYFDSENLFDSIEKFNNSFSICNEISALAFTQRHYSLLRELDKSINFQADL